MKRIAKKQSNFLMDQKGMALFAAFVVLVLLTILGLAGIYLATTDIKISRNYKEIRQRFFVAEAGLQHGVNIIKSTKVDDWGNFLNGANMSNPEVVMTDMSEVPFCGMYYTVSVRNNLDDNVFTDGNLIPAGNNCYDTDGDEILVVISEGRGITGEPKILETAIQWEPKPESSYMGKDIGADNANVTDATIDWT